MLLRALIFLGTGVVSVPIRNGSCEALIFLGTGVVGVPMRNSQINRLRYNVQKHTIARAVGG